MRTPVRSAMSQAYATRDPKRARRLLENLARRLESQYPGAAASLREGLEETLTVMRPVGGDNRRSSALIWERAEELWCHLCHKVLEKMYLPREIFVAQVDHGKIESAESPLWHDFH